MNWLFFSIATALLWGTAELFYKKGAKPDEKYAQLYIPYEYFKAACDRIKKEYSSTNHYAGYHNYMKYWAKNGEYNQICDLSEYSTIGGGFVQVANTYKVTFFWNNYDGTTSPVDGATLGKDSEGNPITAIGFEKKS